MAKNRWKIWYFARMKSTAHRTAIVTGAARGIGAATARRLARDGIYVAVLDLAEGACASVVTEILEAGGRACAVGADVTIEAEVAEAVERVTSELGAPTILVNNAGILRDDLLFKLSLADWDAVMSVHLRGTFLMSRAVLPQMLTRGSGRIINTASQLAYKGAPGFSAYTAAKGAILSLTRSLALEVGPGEVTVNCVAPGATRTPMLEDVPAEILEQIRLSIPLGRLAEVADIVPSYLFLASEQGRHYQGQCLSPNGGDVFL